LSLSFALTFCSVRFCGFHQPNIRMEERVCVRSLLPPSGVSSPLASSRSCSVIGGVVGMLTLHFQWSVNFHFHSHSQNGGREADFSLDG